MYCLDRGWGKSKVGIINEDESGIGVLSKVDGVKTFVCGSKFNHPRVGMNLEHASPIRTVECDSKLLSQLVK